MLTRPAHVFEFANREYLALVDGRDLIGLPVRAALPELAGQGIYEILDNVYRIGRAVCRPIDPRGDSAAATAPTRTRSSTSSTSRCSTTPVA